MKKGMMVNIWCDPLTRKRFEGRARLMKKLDVYCDPGSEYWTVRFHNGDICDRFVTVGDTDISKATGGE